MASSSRRPLLALEFVLLFFVLPTVLTLQRLRLPKLLVLLLVAALCLAWLLRSPDFDRKELWNGAGFRAGVGPVLLLFAASVPLFAAGVLLLEPESFLAFPRRAPAIWGIVMVLYPLVSAYPQELIYRAFLFERYRPLFRTQGALVVLSAIAFGFVHIIYGSALAVGLSTVGGYLFARTYHRSGSLLLATFQHALYGCLIFTIGLGRHFYRGPSF